MHFLTSDLPHAFSYLCCLWFLWQHNSFHSFPKKQLLDKCGFTSTDLSCPPKGASALRWTRSTHVKSFSHQYLFQESRWVIDKKNRIHKALWHVTFFIYCQCTCVLMQLRDFSILLCLPFFCFVYFCFSCNLSSPAETSSFADQVSVDRKALLRIEELCHGHAGPRRSGERDCQAITGKAPWRCFPPHTSLCNNSLPLKLNVSLYSERVWMAFN